jgi:hypothetical protein
MKNIILDKKTRNQLVILLLEGVDEAWWTIPENFEIVNKLREFVGLDVLSEELRKLIYDDLKNMN